jgi:hypothetical protein
MSVVIVMRKILRYSRGIGGAGTVDWELTLDCGHVIKITNAALINGGFMLELECVECQDLFIKEIEMYQVPRQVR